MIRPRTAPATPDDVARHYDDLDRWYRELWGDHVHHGLWETGRESVEEAARNLVRRVADAADVRKDSRVCDVGCGYGAPAELMARERGARVTGFTVSRVQAERAGERARSVPGLTFHRRDWLRNGLPDASFDAVVAIESASHMPDPDAFLAEIVRVLKPGGRAALAAWTAAERPARWETHLLLEPLCREGRLPSLPAESDHRRRMDAAGLHDVRVLDVTRQVRRTWSVCVTRGLRRLAADGELRRFVLRGNSPERVYGLSIFRLWVASRTGAFRYLLLDGQKPL